ncbi:hypothetical protein ASPWEDRAFT_179879 [Aspergillus wentii DTO 134E9]|uniref:AB hydrolase-1 domain-containing protein n=1 Tax=Aspergillus wentii DTO 134E9 TaxID=1073089 RepID=A0A1L9RTR8_ASPWE|nr:uncharacterized protein ASPWEDRAFT_179879 [Aspergillus wentii DTO 134E9]OJJ38315.1 hypothetical protein ASPWEDRAFT_179879 [Aspergillus wentii DTO 134E9]
MQPFQFKLSNDGVVTGVHFVPPLSASRVRHRPLVVALHGGCYDSRYFDGIPKYSASLASEAFGVPFVSIDRPSYGGTSSILPVPEGSDFYQETGTWLHRYILPALWSEIGAPNQCNSIVLLPRYPLAGVIASGMGNKQSSFMRSTAPDYINVDADHVLFPPEKKDAVMFKPGTTVPEVLELCECLNAVSPLPDISQFPAAWLPVWKEKWAAQVSVPVMFSLVDNDPFFVADEEELEICVQAFKMSARVDGSLVRGAPHCMELSHWSQGWYARCFGFAMECSASLASSAETR